MNDGEDQKIGGEMLIKWYETGGVENRPEAYEVHSWVFLIQNVTGHCVVRTNSLDTILKKMASLVEINGYNYSSLFRSRRNNLIDQKN